MHVGLDKVSGPVEWRIVHANTLKVTRARLEHSLHSDGLPLKKSSGFGQNALIKSTGKGSRRCFDHLFESETNYGIKESGEKPVIQLINPHLLTETVVGPSQHGSRTVTQILIPGPSVTAGAGRGSAALPTI